MESEEIDTGTGLVALADVLGGNRYTTKEAREFAMGVLNNYKSTSSALDDTEEDYYDKLDQSAEEAKKVLQKARTYVENRRYNKGRLWLSAAEQLGRTTKSGHFAETMGNVAGGLNKEFANRDKFEDERNAGMTEIDSGLVDIDRKLAEARVAAIQKRRADSDKMATEMAKIAGKEVRGGAGSSGMSPFGKIAADEGFIPDTAQFNARVKQLQENDFRLRQQSAGVDVPDPDAAVEDARVRANNLGIPYLDRDPLAGFSTKGRERRRVQLETEATERLNTSREATAKAKEMLQGFDRFETLNKEMPYTGPLQGWLTQFTDAGSEMKTVTKDYARSKRVAGEGPMSNYDAQTLESMAPSVFKDPNVNKNIIKGAAELKKRQIEYDQFINDYNVAYGHLAGADQAWMAYVNDNPVFDPNPKAKGKFLLNKKKVPYKQYFAIRNGDADGVFEGMTPEEKIGATTPAKARGGRVQMADGGSVSRLEEIGRALAQGASSNWSDELLAGDEDELAEERAILEGYHGEHPVESTLVEIGGALPGSVGSIYAGQKLADRLARSKSRVGKVAGAVTKVLPKSNTGKLAVAGAGSGALTGAGSADDEEGTVIGAGMGAAMGALTGPLAGLATKYGVKSAQGLINLYRGNKLSGPEKKIVEAFIADDLDIGAEGRKIVAENRRGVPSTLGDVPGQNVQKLRQEALTKGVDVDDEVRSLVNRTAATSERARDRVNKTLKPDEYYDAIEDMTDALYTQADPIYKQAYAQNPVVKSKVFKELFTNRDGKRAIRQALRIMQGEGSAVGSVDKATGELRNPSLELMERTRRILRDFSEGAKESNKATEMSRYYRLLSDRLEKEMDNPKVVAGDALQRARAQYKGDHEVLDALNLGRDDFMKLGADEFGQLTKNMSFAEKDALRTGAAHALYDAIDSVKDSSNPVQKVIGNEKIRKKVRALFDSDKEADKFISDLTKESSMFDSSKQLVSAVNKSRGKDENASLQDMATSLGLVSATHGVSTVLGSPGWITRIGNTLSRAARRSPKSTMEEVASKLGETDPRVIKLTSDALDKKLKTLSRQLATQSRAGLGGGLTAASRSGGTGPYGYLEPGDDDEYLAGVDDPLSEGFWDGGPVNMSLGGKLKKGFKKAGKKFIKEPTSFAINPIKAVKDTFEPLVEGSKIGDRLASTEATAKFALKRGAKKVLAHPTDYAQGVDPISTGLRNKIGIGRKSAPLVNLYGSPTEDAYRDAEAAGIDTKGARDFFKIGDAVAGYFGGSAAMRGLGNAYRSWQAGRAGLPSGTGSAGGAMEPGGLETFPVDDGLGPVSGGGDLSPVELGSNTVKVGGGSGGLGNLGSFLKNPQNIQRILGLGGGLLNMFGNKGGGGGEYVDGPTYGTDKVRTRRTLPANIDWAHYGEGPEQQYWDYNRIPDARYTTQVWKP